MEITIEKLEASDINHFLFNQYFELWWSDFEESGVESCFVAFDEDDNVMGFQTVNRDGFCVAIEVREQYQGKGVALALIEESGCYRPEQNENPEFWDKIKEKYID